MPVDVLTEILIRRPRAEVAAFAGDPGRAPEWYVNIKSVEWETSPPLAVGSRMAFVADFLGRRLAYIYEVRELVPGERLVMSTAEGPFPMETTYTWADEGADTRMTLRNRGEPSGFSMVMAPVMAVMMRRANAADLAKLRGVMEAGAGSAGAPNPGDGASAAVGPWALGPRPTGSRPEGHRAPAVPERAPGILPDPWSGDLNVVWAALDRAWGYPTLERVLLQWMSRRSPREWARLEASGRSPPWRRNGPAATTPSSTLSEGWRSFAADGRVREAAVRALTSFPDEVANAFLLVRCDDWVDQVRAAARKAAFSRAQAGKLDVATWLPLILARDSRSRAGRLADELAAMRPPELEPLLACPDRRTRRWALRRLLAEGPAADRLERMLRGTADPSVARALAARLVALVDDAGLERLLRDRRAGVRKAAWEQVQTGRLPGLNLTVGLLDSAPTVRALAQSIARARKLEAGPVYLSAPVGSPAQRRRRLVGLGEWGAPEAEGVARAALGDADVSVRVGAIGVLALRLDEPGSVLLDLLSSVRGPELRAVRRGLLSRKVPVSEPLLVWLRAGQPEQRLTAWRLGRARGRWERLVAALYASYDADDALARAASADLGNWIQRVGPEVGWPNADQRRAVETAMASAPAGSRPNPYLAFLLRT